MHLQRPKEGVRSLLMAVRLLTHPYRELKSGCLEEQEAHQNTLNVLAPPSAISEVITITTPANYQPHLLLLWCGLNVGIPSRVHIRGLWEASRPSKQSLLIERDADRVSWHRLTSYCVAKDDL